MPSATPLAGNAQLSTDAMCSGYKLGHTFIPTWLLVVGVVLLILVLSRRGEVADFVQTLGCLAVGVGFCGSVEI